MGRAPNVSGSGRPGVLAAVSPQAAAVCVGVGSYLCLAHRSYVSSLFYLGDSGIAPLSYYALFLAFSMAMAAGMFLWGRFRGLPDADSPTVRLLTLVLVAAGACVTYSASGGGLVPLLAFGLVSLAYGTVYLALAWTQAVASLAPSRSDVVAWVTGSFAVSALLSFLGAFVPDYAQIAYAILCPLLSFVALEHLCVCAPPLLGAPGGGAPADAGGGSLTLLDVVYFALAFVVCSALLGCNFGPGLGNAVTPIFIGTYAMLCAACAALIVLAPALSGRPGLLGLAVCAGVLAMLAAFLLMALFGGGWVLLGGGVVASARLCFELTLWIAFFEAVVGGRARVWVVLPLFLAFRLLSEVLINLVMPLLAPSEDAYVVLMGAFLVASFLFLAGRLYLLFSGRQPSQGEQRAPNPDQAEDGQSPAAAPEAPGRDGPVEGYGLSQREVEVMEYLARGYSFQAIADRLCVSTSTVQSHAKHIYRKLGVHTKQELIELVDRG